eukprot:5871575-Karenia_brevis.AAC.1
MMMMMMLMMLNNYDHDVADADVDDHDDIASDGNKLMFFVSLPTQHIRALSSQQWLFLKCGPWLEVQPLATR